MRRDSLRFCPRCPTRTHRARCPRCVEACLDAPIRANRRLRGLRVGLLGIYLAMLVAWPALVVTVLGPRGTATLWFVWAILHPLLASAAVAGLAAGLRGAKGISWRLRPPRRRVVSTGMPRPRDPIGAATGRLGALMRRLHRVVMGPGYGFGAFGFVASLIVTALLQLNGVDDFRLTLAAVVVSMAFIALSTPLLVLQGLEALGPPPRIAMADPGGSRALAEALEGRPVVDGVAESAGAQVLTPLGDPVLAWRLVGTLGGDDVDEGDAAPFVVAAGAARWAVEVHDGLVAGSAEGDPVDPESLDRDYLAARGIFARRGRVVLHRLRPGDRVQVAGAEGRVRDGAGYREGRGRALVADGRPVVVRWRNDDNDDDRPR